MGEKEIIGDLVGEYDRIRRMIVRDMRRRFKDLEQAWNEDKKRLLNRVPIGLADRLADFEKALDDIVVGDNEFSEFVVKLMKWPRDTYKDVVKSNTEIFKGCIAELSVSWHNNVSIEIRDHYSTLSFSARTGDWLGYTVILKRKR